MAQTAWEMLGLADPTQGGINEALSAAQKASSNASGQVALDLLGGLFSGAGAGGAASGGNAYLFPATTPAAASTSASAAVPATTSAITPASAPAGNTVASPSGGVTQTAAPGMPAGTSWTLKKEKYYPDQFDSSTAYDAWRLAFPGGTSVVYKDPAGLLGYGKIVGYDSAMLSDMKSIMGL